MKWFRCKNLVLQPSRKITVGEMGANAFQSDVFLHDTRHFFVLFFLPKRRAEQTVDNLDIV